MFEKIVAFFTLLFLPLTQMTSNLSNSIVSQNEEFAFQELTIPFLRNKEYKSEIGELNKLSETGTYESYLTSYMSDGLKINGLLTIPKGNEPEGGFPAIVFVHGYIPPETYRTTEKYVAYIDYLARNGFVVFKIDLRGHGDSEGEPGGAYYSSDYVIDTLNAYVALQNFNSVNPNKIGLWGHSMAGNVTSRAVSVKQDIPAAVIWAGAGYTYSDFLDLGIGDNSYRPPTNNTERARKRRLLTEYYGTFSADSWFWKQVPFVNYLDGVTTKLQLHHSINDDVVSVEYSRNLDKVLDATQIEHEVFEYQTGGHNITSPAFNTAMQKTVVFYNENLK